MELCRADAATLDHPSFWSHPSSLPPAVVRFYAFLARFERACRSNKNYKGSAEHLTPRMGEEILHLVRQRDTSFLPIRPPPLQSNTRKDMGDMLKFQKLHHGEVPLDPSGWHTVPSQSINDLRAYLYLCAFGFKFGGPGNTVLPARQIIKCPRWGQSVALHCTRGFATELVVQRFLCNSPCRASSQLNQDCCPCYFARTA